MKAYQAGQSTIDLAKTYGIHRSSVLEHLDRRGITRRHVHARLTPNLVTQAAERYNAGATTAELAELFKVSAETMRVALKTSGVPMRPKGRSRR